MVGVWVWVWEGLGAHGLDHGLTNLGLGLGEWWGSGGGGLGGSGVHDDTTTGSDGYHN